MYGRSFNFIFIAALIIAGAAPELSVAQDVIRIGAPLPLTGPLSPEGIKQKQGYDLWAEVANSKGGVKASGKSYKVEIVYVDYASNTPRAVQTAERLITEDKVNFCFRRSVRAQRRRQAACRKNTKFLLSLRPPPRNRSMIRVTNICSGPLPRTTP